MWIMAACGSALFSPMAQMLISIFLMGAIILLSLFLPLIVYALRLGASGVKLPTFIKGLPALLFENLKINSTIDDAKEKARG